jgi:hypothetical protein
MLKIPEGVFLDEQPDGGYSVALGNLVDTADMPTSFWIKTTDTNAIPMADLFPKGCLEREITLASKSFERFDCLPQTNVEGNGATTLFRQEEGFYYTINFNKTQNTLLDYYTEAILLSLTFDQDTE